MEPVVTEGESVSNVVEAGTVIGGKYRLESLIAEGGMGAVWVATNLLLESKVAIKVLHRSLIQNPGAATRLLVEARAAARVSHRNIVQVFDFGHIDTGEPFIVMELLRGETLAERIERAGRLPDTEAVEILLPVVHALSTAHAKGVIHRDLKPLNVFLAIDESGVETPKLVDFGIAKVEGNRVRRATVDGSVFGSPEYLSPEQARGESVIDARADIWALAVTLYEAITGGPPFEDPVNNRLLRMIIEDEPTPTTDYCAGDFPLWDILKKGLAKNPADRWQSAHEMGEALEQWLEGRGVFTAKGTFARRSGASSESHAIEVTLEIDEPSAAPAPSTARKVPSSRRSLWIPIAGAIGVLILSLTAVAWHFKAGSPPAPSSPTLPPASLASPSPPAPAEIPSASAAAPVVSNTASSAPPVASEPTPAKPRGMTKLAPPRSTKPAPVPLIPMDPNY